VLKYYKEINIKWGYQNMKRNKKIWLVFLAGLLLVLTIPVQAAEWPADIKGHWAAVEINSATSEGWAYIENDKFNPNKPASREEVIWMLIGTCETVQVNGFDANKKADMTAFKDEPSTWAKERMAIAIGNGYIQGYTDKTIKAQSNITRAEFAVMLSRLIEGDLYIHIVIGSNEILSNMYNSCNIIC
jgi:hypothetical protein